MKKVVGYIIGLGIGFLVFSHFFGADKAVERKLSKVADQINSQCPLMVDNETQLDEVVAGPGKKFTYIYTLVNYGLADIDVDFIESSVKPQLIADITAKKEMKLFSDSKVDLIYEYYSRDGEEITQITITPDDYD